MIEFIKKWEGCRLKAYRCEAGVLTIGYGHTGKDVLASSEITQKQADELLAKDVARIHDGVKKLVKVPISPNQEAALVSFAFNCGVRALQISTLLKRLNGKDYKGAADAFLRWVMVTQPDGKKAVSKGLQNRRTAERALFLNEVS